MNESTDLVLTTLSPHLAELLAQSAALHRHLCPRQVLGVRMGVLAGLLLRLTVPQTNKRLFTFVETDGCFADGVATATNCWVGRRTMRLIDYGKVAATFVDSATGCAVRIVPHPGARDAAAQYAPDARSRWHTMLYGYQMMPDEALLSWRPVRLTLDLEALISRPGARSLCDMCGEEIVNEREIHRDGAVLCRACAEGAYYADGQSV